MARCRTRNPRKYDAEQHQEACRQMAAQTADSARQEAESACRAAGNDSLGFASEKLGQRSAEFGAMKTVNAEWDITSPSRNLPEWSRLDAATGIPLGVGIAFTNIGLNAFYATMGGDRVKEDGRTVMVGSLKAAERLAEGTLTDLRAGILNDLGTLDLRCRSQPAGWWRDTLAGSLASAIVHAASTVDALFERIVSPGTALLRRLFRRTACRRRSTTVVHSPAGSLPGLRGQRAGGWARRGHPHWRRRPRNVGDPRKAHGPGAPRVADVRQVLRHACTGVNLNRVPLDSEGTAWVAQCHALVREAAPFLSAA